jgi:hypothetical protein
VTSLHVKLTIIYWLLWKRALKIRNDSYVLSSRMDTAVPRPTLLSLKLG